MQRLLFVALIALTGLNSFSQVWTGTNPSGTSTDLTVPVGASATNLSLIVNGSASSWSYLLVKKGGAPADDTDYDFSAQLDGGTNAIHLEYPEVEPGEHLVVRVKTPAGSASHSFTVSADFNQPGLRTSSKPVTKSFPGLAYGLSKPTTNHYYRVEIKEPTYWIIGLNTTNNSPDLYVARDSVPTTASYYRRSTGSTNNLLAFSATEATPGVYYIGVLGANVSASGSYYKLRTETVHVEDLVWDPGLTHEGTAAVNKTNAPQEAYFRIVTSNPAVGAWRTALKMFNGDASLYLGRGFLPTPTTNSFSAQQTGSVGLVLALGTQFQPGEEWFILVKSTQDSNWRLTTGTPYVQDLGTLAAGAQSSSQAVEIGPEGIRFFKTQVQSEVLAWRLWLNGLTNRIVLKKASVPLSGTGMSDTGANGQMLIVPPYLTASQYFIGVVGTPGTIVALDSRQQPITDLPYNGAIATNLVGYGYSTYRVSVPANQIAWQLYLPSSGGNPHMAVRRGVVPNETANDAFSELSTTNADNITLVPPTLSDGTFYITVYATNQADLSAGLLQYTLQEGTPAITDIPYRGQVTNNDPTRAGWRFYRISDVEQQLNSLGWNLSLSNASPGTRIALRRANVPSLWSYRNPALTPVNNYDVLSSGNFLQRPEHEPDTWYIGVYNPTNILGPFVLNSGDLTPRPLTENVAIVQTNNLPGRWEFYTIELKTEDTTGPNAIVGWDLRLKDVTGGSPKIVVRKDKLPISTQSTFLTASSTSWPPGGQWAAGQDWTKRSLSPDGLTNEDGRVLAMGLGHPLTPGTYYIGVNNTGTNTADFTLLSRWIGRDRTIPVTDIEYAGGAVTNSLAPREAAYYRVVVTNGAPSWKTHLQVDNGEAMLVVITNSPPSSNSEKRMQKPGDEYFLRLPEPGAGWLPQTVYYLAVIGEGQEPTTTKIGAGMSDYVIHSRGALQVIDLGSLAQDDLLFTNTLAAGDTIAVQFHPVQGTWGFWSVLEDVIGNPWEVLRSGPAIPDPGSVKGGTRDAYGNEGGEDDDYASSPYRISSAGAWNLETVILKARSYDGEWEDASFVLRIKPVKVKSLVFDGGVTNIINGEPEYGDFFVVDVPEQALGWDVRVTNVTSGYAGIYVGKDVVPLGPWVWGSNVDPLDKSTWPYGAWIDAWYDYTERPFGPEGEWEANQILMVSKDRPMPVPGRYFIQVVNEFSDEPLNCTLISRGVAPNMTIPIAPLDFAGGSTSVAALPPREAAYYRIEVPTNSPSWKVRLSETSGESILAILKDRPPNVGSDYKKSTRTEAGRRMLRTGDETFLLLPGPGKDTLDGGSYYAAVISEGMTNPDEPWDIGTNSSSFQIVSLGEASRMNLGTFGPETNSVAHTNSLIGGDTQIYEFTVAAGTTAIEARLENLGGSPAMSARTGIRVPDPSPAVGKLPLEHYGVEGGETAGVTASTNLLSWANPAAGTYTLLVKARMETNATYVLRVNSINVQPAPTYSLGFDVSAEGDTNALSVTDQPGKSWSYFIVNVPTNTLGWDVRVSGVSGGSPKMVVRRGTMPTALTTVPWSSPGNALSWPTNSQWAPGQDWTKRSGAPDGTNEDGRILAMGMGRPLEPGVYFVGVTNASTNATSYSILSRGIGSGFSIPVLDLPLNGSITNLALAAREAAYYRVIIPSNSPSWKVQVNILTNIGGECMITGLRGNLPNFTTVSGTGLSTGKTMQKPGNEHFVLLPGTTQTNLPASTNYFAVVGEGKNPVGTTRVGTGETGYVITSEPQLPIMELGIVTSEDIVQPDALQAGEVKAYRFTVFPGTYGVKIKLENRAGNPVAAFIQGNKLPNPGAAVTGAAAETYGNEGGQTPADGNPNILTLANATPGNYLVLIKARANATTFPDASYSLRVSEILSPQLNFAVEENTNGLRNTAIGLLENNERMFYRFEIPAQLQGLPIIGWKLKLEQSSGLATMRVAKDVLPQDGATPLMGWTSASAVIAPPYLTNGVWFAEVRGSNATAFTLTSEALRLERPEWVMPAPGQPNPNPGVAEPYFGDTAVSTNGAPIEETVFIEEGAMHYYAVRVPSNNWGLLRMELRATSGNPDLYLRPGAVPSLQHSASGGTGTIYERSMTAARDTEYANWVPLDSKSETRLQPGLWYLVVKAASNSNARYRLLLSSGNVVDIGLNGGMVTNQTALGGDWAYYRVTVPAELPGSLGIVFEREYGDGVLYVRDVVPPGNGTNTASNNFKDWKSDGKNAGPYPSFNTQGEYTLNTPPIRPGQVLYFGLQAPSRSIFGLRVTNYVQNAVLPELIDFYGGSGSAILAPGESKVFKVVVPPEAARWKHTSVHTTNVVVSLDQGSMPTLASYEWRGTGANTTLNKPLLSWSTSLSQYVPAAWPWVPGQDYYFVVSNNGQVEEAITIDMDGRNQETDDNDSNGLPDGWEMLYFGRTGQVGTADPDRDAVVNIDEYIEGTNPNDATSFNARLFIIGPYGTVLATPNLMSYPLGTEVLLSAFPDSGYSFSGWGQDLSGRENPKTIIMNGHKTVTVMFRKAGDDFLAAIPLVGQNVVTTARNVGYTRETGEPYHAGNYGGRSIWWKWTAPINGAVTLCTEGSTFNTLLAVYRAATPNPVQFSFPAVGLTLLGSDNNSSGVPAQRSRVVFNATAGQEYHIAVDGFDGASANIQLSLVQSAVVPQPVLGQCVPQGQGMLVPVSGPAGETYTVEYSTDLSNWTEMGNVTLDMAGEGSFSDAAPAVGSRFYRLKKE